MNILTKLKVKYILMSIKQILPSLCIYQSKDMNHIIKSIDQLPRTIDGTVFGELTNNAVNKRLKVYCKI